MQAYPQSTSAAPMFASPLTLTASPHRQNDVTTISPANAKAVPSAGCQPSFGGSLTDGAGLAHDAGNLLQALGLYSELLQSPGVLRPEHMHYATELRHLAERSSTMILRLLKGLSASETPQPHSQSLPPSAAASTNPFEPRAEQPSEAAASAISPSRCPDPAQTLHDQAPLLQRLTAPWAIISIATQDRLPGLDFSAEILERVIVNLVLNAAEALRSAAGASDSPYSVHSRLAAERSTQISLASGEQGVEPQKAGSDRSATEPVQGRIRVSLRMMAGRLRLSVEDNGPGVPPGIAAAFLRPTPLPTGAARGLGHRIVHELATSTGGQLSVQPRPGGGTAFSLDWPVRMPVSADAEGRRLSNAPALRLVSAPAARRNAPLSIARSATSTGSAGNRAITGGLEAC